MKDIVHRDIKLENMLIDKSPKPILKLCDFGFSKHKRFQSRPASKVGTPAYLAPEVIMNSTGDTYDGQVCPSSHAAYTKSLSTQTRLGNDDV